MARTRIVHVAAKQRDSANSILIPERAAWLWAALERQFPRALAATLMRDHLHVVTPVVDVAALRASLGRVLGHYARRFAFGEKHWRPIGEPIPVRHRTMLRMTVRYVALNACRDRSAADPLEPLWSTHRDVVGAVARPWVDAARLARAFGYPHAGFRERYHQFVSKDPAVDVDGTPGPTPASRSLERPSDLGAIGVAAATAYRETAAAVGRSGRVRALFVALAEDQGWHDRDALIEASASSRTTVNRLLRARVDAQALHAARLCLGDARLCREAPACGFSPPPANAIYQRRNQD